MPHFGPTQRGVKTSVRPGSAACSVPCFLLGMWMCLERSIFRVRNVNFGKNYLSFGAGTERRKEPVASRWISAGCSLLNSFSGIQNREPPISAFFYKPHGHEQLLQFQTQFPKISQAFSGGLCCLISLCGFGFWASSPPLPMGCFPSRLPY